MEYEVWTIQDRRKHADGEWRFFDYFFEPMKEIVPRFMSNEDWQSLIDEGLKVFDITGAQGVFENKINLLKQIIGFWEYVCVAGEFRVKKIKITVEDD